VHRVNDSVPHDVEVQQPCKLGPSNTVYGEEVVASVITVEVPVLEGKFPMLFPSSDTEFFRSSVNYYA
jgi:hypothetical protein